MSRVNCPRYTGLCSPQPFYQDTTILLVSLLSQMDMQQFMCHEKREMVGSPCVRHCSHTALVWVQCEATGFSCLYSCPYEALLENMRQFVEGEGDLLPCLWSLNLSSFCGTRSCGSWTCPERNFPVKKLLPLRQYFVEQNKTNIL